MGLEYLFLKSGKIKISFDICSSLSFLLKSLTELQLQLDRETILLLVLWLSKQILKISFPTGLYFQI